MIKKVYLLWNSYSTNELLTIGSLEELNEKLYLFKFEKDAKKAFSDGCFLPFNYTDGCLYFDSLPLFFEQRMLKGEYNSEKFGINYNNSNKLGTLIFRNAQKNNDNFMVVSEEFYEKMVPEVKGKNL